MDRETARRDRYVLGTAICLRNLLKDRATVMAMAVSRDNSLALTISADHLVGRYDLTVRLIAPSSATRA